MLVLVTSGGTRVPIDDVRWIGNRSTGGFGASLVEACLEQGADVIHLHAREAVLPFSRRINLLEATDADWQDLRAAADRCRSLRSRYSAVSFVTFRDYARELEAQVRGRPIAIAFLAAAVADYAPEPIPGKLSSDDPAPTLTLRKTPKLIERLKDWRPEIFQVGFKLTAGATAHELVAIARRAMAANRSDAMVANDWRVKDFEGHVVHLLSRDGAQFRFGPGGEVARQVVRQVFEWYQQRRAADE